MKKILCYDSETTGFPLKDRPDDHPGQPHLVELGLRLMTEDEKMLQSVSMIVRPDGWTIPEAASNVHGITHDLAMEVGLPLKLVVATWTNLRRVADEIVAHNEEFDDQILRVAERRAGFDRTTMTGYPVRRCTARLATPIVNLPPTPKMLAAGFNRPKTPNLTEAVKFFFNEEFAGAHRAAVDTEQCGRVFFELRRRGAVS